MPYTIARHAGYCAGVRKAMEIAFQAAREAREAGITCYSLGELIHNPEAVKALHEEGVIPVGRVEEAVGQLETCLQIMKACGYPEDSAHMLSTMNTYATMLNIHGARRKALNMMQRLYAVYERQGRKDTMEGLCLGNNMARTMEGLGQLREAAAWMAEVVKMEETVSVGWQTHAIHLRNYASLLCRTGDFRRAMPYAEEALSPREEGMSADDPAIADARSVLAFPGTSAGHWIWPAQPMRSSWPSPRSTP